jgi:hypothetical protein
MGEAVPAIDFMYYVATPEFMAKWDRAKEGELICRMERAIGGLRRLQKVSGDAARPEGLMPHWFSGSRE